MTGRIEIERMVADWLGTDVNARIAAVPRDGSDPAPPAIHAYTASGIGDDVATPNNLAIFDSTRHSVVTDRKAPPAAPALYVTCQGPILFKGEPIQTGQLRYIAVPVKVVIKYLTTNGDKAIARRDGSYTLRAVARSLRALSKTMPQLRGSIEVISQMDPLEFWPVTETIGAFRVAGALVVHYDLRDEQPEF